jgi:hypothetical protein
MQKSTTGPSAISQLDPDPDEFFSQRDSMHRTRAKTLNLAGYVLASSTHASIDSSADGRPGFSPSIRSKRVAHRRSTVISLERRSSQKLQFALRLAVEQQFLR